MKKKIAFYIFVLLALFFPVFITNSMYAYIAVVFFILLSVISAAYTLLLKLSIESMDMLESTECYRDDDVQLKMNVKNKSFLFFPKIQTTFSVSAENGEDVYNKSACFMLESFENKEFNINVKMNHIGQYHVGIQDMRIYGLFSIFSIKVKSNNSAEVLVKPMIYNYQSSGDLMAYSDETSKSSTSIMGGNDYAGVREYEQGDSIKYIHWKLSSRGESFYTNQFERFSSGGISIILDLDCLGENDEETMQLRDTIIETALSVAHHAKKYGYKYEILYAKNGVKQRYAPPHFYELKPFVDEISKAHNTDFNIDSLLKEQCYSSNQSGNIVFCSSNINEHKVQLLSELKNANKQPCVYYARPKSKFETSSSRELLYLEENNITYHVLNCAKEIQNVG